MNDVRNILPAVLDTYYSAWGGNPPTSFLHAKSGAVFYGRNERDTRTRAIHYAVYSIDPAGAIRTHLRVLAGQGTLAIDNGWLILTVFIATGDGKGTQRIAVPGWTI